MLSSTNISQPTRSDSPQTQRNICPPSGQDLDFGAANIIRGKTVNFPPPLHEETPSGIVFCANLTENVVSLFSSALPQIDGPHTELVLSRWN